MRQSFLLLLAVVLLFISASPKRSADVDFSVQPIPDSVFARMQGRSYPQGCPVERSDLRYVRLLHVDVDGHVHRGEMICNRRIANDVVAIFRELYRQRYPIERVRLIDDYNADDEQSMRANNTSCFCYRAKAAGNGLSRHALGMAVDVNTLYNPYYRRRSDGSEQIEPATARPYLNRAAHFHYKIVRGDLCYRLFIQHGFSWGGEWRRSKDYQHFEK